MIIIEFMYSDMKFDDTTITEGWRTNHIRPKSKNYMVVNLKIYHQ